MMKDSTMATPESTEEESSPFQNMQTELHSKGAVLTKAWSDLFTFITKYQCELTVKENAVEIAEREIEVRKKQLEDMKPAMNSGNEEVEKLRDEIHMKESRLKLSQSELSAKEQMLQQLQSDLSCNRELSEKLRCELLEKQTELIQNRSDLEQLKSELVIKQDQIQIKDNLLKKMQSQMMRENAELKEQLDLERRTLELERRSHEQTKRILSESRGKSKSSGAGAGAGPSRRVIEIPDSPPTLDLSVEQSNYGLANIISMTESQTSRSQSMEGVYSGIQVSQSNAESALSRMATMSGGSFSGPLSSPQTLPSVSSHHHTQWKAESPTMSPRSKIPRHSPSFLQTPPQSQSDSFTSTAASSMSDVYFPLSISHESNQRGMDTSNPMFDPDSKVPGQILGAMPGTPSSGTSDSSQSAPVPISGPIPSGAMSPGGGFGMPFGTVQQEGADGKVMVAPSIPKQKKSQNQPRTSDKREYVKKQRHSGEGKEPHISCNHKECHSGTLCHADKLTPDDLWLNHQVFYETSDKVQQDEMLLRMMTVSGKKRSRVRAESRMRDRDISIKYSLLTMSEPDKVPVCKRTFASVLGIGSERAYGIARYYASHGAPRPERRGGHKHTEDDPKK